MTLQYTIHVRAKSFSPYVYGILQCFSLKLKRPKLFLKAFKMRGIRVVSALASCAIGPGFDPHQWRGKFVGPNTLPYV